MVTGQGARPGRLEWALALAAGLACILFGLAQVKPATIQAYDQPLYLSIASDLLTSATYTNGRYAGPPGAPGAYTAPLYPGLVAGLAALDPRLAATAACARRQSFAGLAGCGAELGILLPLQVLLFAATLAVVWRSALALGGSRWAAWVALFAAGLGTREYAVYARTAMTEALSLPLAAWCGLLLVWLVRRPGWPVAAGLGLGLGLLTLARPEYLYLGLVLLLAAAGMAVWWRRRVAVALAGACVLAACVVAPWSLRNERLFGTWQPTYGYSGFILAQRMAYEAMTPREWVAQWLYSLPGFGPALARKALPDAVGRLGWQDRPDTFYMVGNTTAVQELRAAAPDPRDQVGWLLGHYVWPHPFRFAAITVVMAWKSLWVRKYFSLVAAPFLAVMLWRAVRRPDPAQLAFLLPSVFIVALHAATTVATPRYSLILIPAYAVAFGLVVGPWLQRMVPGR